MSVASVDPILGNSDWHRGESFDVQVVPHGKRPGVFLARIIIKDPGQMQAALHPLFQPITRCDEITELHVFIANQQAEGRLIHVPGQQITDFLPEVISKAFVHSRFLHRCKYFLLPPGQTPSEPVYPVWTRDEKRSMQVVDGKYSEITPISFEFIPTLNCIYRCHECAYRVPKEFMGLWQHNNFANTFHMDLPTMQRLLDRLRAADINEVLFTGGGEPLVNAGTPEAMHYATEIGIPRVGLYTNGALITPAKAQALLAARPAYIRVSLNAGTPGVHHQHHNPLTPGIDYFTRTLKAIESLAETKQACGSNSSLGISYLVDADNVGDVTEAARLVVETAARYPGTINYMRFTPSVNYYGSKQHEQDLFEAAVVTIREQAVPILKDAGVDAPVYYHRFSGLYEPRTYNQCLASGWYGGLGPGGILYWCCEKLFHPDFSFGSLLDRPLDEIWAGPERRAVARHVSEAVLGGTSSPCPVVCKPHEHNKVFAQIERLREAGRIAIVVTWLQQIHELKKRQLSEPPLFNFSSQCPSGKPA